MALSVLSKVALCVCPPVALATTVAAVPPVKRAVHHATAKPAPRPVARNAAAGPARAADVPCVPVAPGAAGVPVPVAPLVTFADPGLSDLGDLPGIPGGAGGGVTPGATAPVGFPPIATPGLPGGFVPDAPGTPGNPTNPNTPAVPETGAVPEPATWALMISGFALVGTAVRRRRRSSPGGSVSTRVRFASRIGGIGGTLASGSFGAGEAAGSFAAMPTLSAAVTKAALCVCPPALLATAAVTVPPVRNAVHAATAPVLNAASPIPGVTTLLPCPEVTFAPTTGRSAGSAVAVGEG